MFAETNSEEEPEDYFFPLTLRQRAADRPRSPLESVSMDSNHQ